MSIFDSFHLKSKNGQEKIIITPLVFSFYKLLDGYVFYYPRLYVPGFLVPGPILEPKRLIDFLCTKRMFNHTQVFDKHLYMDGIDELSRIIMP